MTMQLLSTMSYMLFYAFWVLLICFGIWVYRKFELRSLPWAFAYIVLALIANIPTHGISNATIENATKPEGYISPQIYFHFLVTDSIWSSATRLLLIILILADVAFLISKAGGNLTGRFAQFWHWTYDKSTAFGCILVALLIFRLIWLIAMWRIL